MKRIFLGLALACLATWASAYPVLIHSWDVKADLRQLDELRISVDNVNWSHGRIVADVRDDEAFSALLDQGFDVAKLPDIAHENALRLNSDKSLDAPKDEYYTIDQYNQFMVSTAAQYPNLCTLVQAGSSGQGRPLYFLKISDNPNLAEAEPEFKYISSIHGNEVLGYDMCIRLIQLLTSQYGTDTRITNLVNGTEIWICPLMNPDGFVLGQRYNAAGIDLNRNFPMPTGEQHPDGNPWGAETVAMMNLCNAHTFILAANFHCGSLVMNYPWDYTYALAPDDALLQSAALTYSIHNTPMYNSSEFEDGITNGAAWYVITGSMQDWNYGLTSCTEITAEICNDFWPPASTLPTYWAQNKESMLSYMEFVHKGIHGLVTSSTGSPLNASITIQGNSKTVRTDPEVGDYHRMLLPGTYTVTAQAAGYIPQTVQITVPTGGSCEYNFTLETAGVTDFTGQVRDADGFGLAGLQVALNTDPVSTATTDAQGCFLFSGLTEGIYQISFALPGQDLYSSSLLLTQEEARQVFVIPEAAVLLNDPCESITNWTATSPWGVSTYQGESVITDSPAGNYANNITKALRLTTPISLQNIIDPVLSFDTVYALENGYDFVNVQASATLSNWTTLASLTGTQSSWQRLSYSLAQFSGQSIYVRFVIDTDWSQNADGIYLDNIKISGNSASQPIYGDVNGNGRITRADLQCLLDYVVGYDPLPELDPLPWEAGRVAACDVDLNQNLNSADAYLIQRYLWEPSFRFEAQSGEEAAFTPVTVTPTQLPNAPDIHYYLTFAPPGQIRCFDFQLCPVNQVEMTELQLIPYDAGLASSNALENRFAWISPGTASLQELHLYYQTVLSVAYLNYTANGADGVLELPTGSPSDDPTVPQPVFSLAQNSPNPFRVNTSISFSLAQKGQPVSLRIYNTRGQLVRMLIDGILPSGAQRASWDGRDDSGQIVASGVYLCRLQSGGETLTRRLLRLK